MYALWHIPSTVSKVIMCTYEQILIKLITYGVCCFQLVLLSCLWLQLDYINTYIAGYDNVRLTVDKDKTSDGMNKKRDV